MSKSEDKKNLVIEEWEERWATLVAPSLDRSKGEHVVDVSALVPTLWLLSHHPQSGVRALGRALHFDTTCQNNGRVLYFVILPKSYHFLLQKFLKKICTEGPPPVPFGDCEKRTTIRSALSFAFRLLSLAQELPLSNIYAIAFLFFLSLRSNWQKPRYPWAKINSTRTLFLLSCLKIFFKIQIKKILYLA